MKLSDNSIKLFKFFSKYNIIPKLSLKEKAKQKLDTLYKEILESFEYIQIFLSSQKCELKYKEIKSSIEIRYPNNFSLNDFPKEIIEQINHNISAELWYQFHLFSRDINVFFLLEDMSHNDFSVYDEYIKMIISWLYILNKYSSKKCAESINIYIYHTSLTKNLPSTNIDMIGTNHANTAFTTTCPLKSEIVIFRKEEWFKVFIHETFHNFGLDFSGMNNNNCKSEILKIFDVESQVNLYESYAETWACIINAMYSSFIYIKDINDKNDFFKHLDSFLQLERTYSFFQMVKTLHFMGLKYENLYEIDDYDKVLRDTLFKENTNVLSYYIIKTILINNYTGFIIWCDTNNNQLINFRKSLINIDNFCKFIKKNFKTKSMLSNVDKIELFFQKSYRKNKNKYEYNFLYRNLRMSICELD